MNSAHADTNLLALGPAHRNPRRDPDQQGAGRGPSDFRLRQHLGEEVYFDTGVSVALEDDAQQVVAPGTVAFWTEGDALALPYGPTPISRGGESRLASPCNVLGSFDGDPRLLSTVRDGDPVRVELA